MKEVIAFCFKNRQGKYIEITIYSGTCINDTNKLNMSFDKNYLNLAINYLLEKCLLNVVSLTFHQTIDIPTRSDLDINVKQWQFETELYDKRDAFFLYC